MVGIKQVEVGLVLPFEGDAPGVPEVMLSQEMMSALALGVGSKLEVRNPKNEERVICTVAFPDKRELAKANDCTCVLLEIGVIRKLGLAKTDGGFSGVLLFPDFKGGPF